MSTCDQAAPIASISSGESSAGVMSLGVAAGSAPAGDAGGAAWRENELELVAAACCGLAAGAATRLLSNWTGGAVRLEVLHRTKATAETISIPTSRLRRPMGRSYPKTQR